MSLSPENGESASRELHCEGFAGGEAHSATVSPRDGEDEERDGRCREPPRKKARIFATELSVHDCLPPTHDRDVACTSNACSSSSHTLQRSHNSSECVSSSLGGVPTDTATSMHALDSSNAGFPEQSSEDSQTCSSSTLHENLASVRGKPRRCTHAPPAEHHALPSVASTFDELLGNADECEREYDPDEFEREYDADECDFFGPPPIVAGEVVISGDHDRDREASDESSSSANRYSVIEMNEEDKSTGEVCEETSISTRRTTCCSQRTPTLEESVPGPPGAAATSRMHSSSSSSRSPSEGKRPPPAPSEGERPHVSSEGKRPPPTRSPSEGKRPLPARSTCTCSDCTGKPPSNSSSPSGKRKRKRKVFDAEIWPSVEGEDKVGDTGGSPRLDSAGRKRMDLEAYFSDPRHRNNHCWICKKQYKYASNFVKHFREKHGIDCYGTATCASIKDKLKMIRPEDCQQLWDMGIRRKLWCCPICNKVTTKKDIEAHPCVVERRARGEGRLGVKELLRLGNWYVAHQELRTRWHAGERDGLWRCPQCDLVVIAEHRPSHACIGTSATREDVEVNPAMLKRLKQAQLRKRWDCGEREELWRCHVCSSVMMANSREWHTCVKSRAPWRCPVCGDYVVFHARDRHVCILNARARGENVRALFARGNPGAGEARNLWDRGFRMMLWLCHECGMVIYESTSNDHACVKRLRARGGNEWLKLIERGETKNNMHTLPAHLREDDGDLSITTRTRVDERAREFRRLWDRGYRIGRWMCPECGAVMGTATSKRHLCVAKRRGARAGDEWKEFHERGKPKNNKHTLPKHLGTYPNVCDP